MRKLYLMTLAISLVMAFGASSAFAAKGGEKGSGKPCPESSPVGQLNEALGTALGAPSCGNPKPGNGNGNGNGGGNTCPPNSPNPGGTPPNCGHPPVDTCNDGKDNDNDGKTDGADEECKPGGDGDEDGSDNAPAGNCSLADLVLLTEDAKIVCLYLGENAENATKEGDCPDALIALPVSPVVGACVFLPPEGSGGVPELPGLPEVPGLPTP